MEQVVQLPLPGLPPPPAAAPGGEPPAFALEITCPELEGGGSGGSSSGGGEGGGGGGDPDGLKAALRASLTAELLAPQPALQPAGAVASGGVGAALGAACGDTLLAAAPRLAARLVFAPQRALAMRAQLAVVRAGGARWAFALDLAVRRWAP